LSYLIAGQKIPEFAHALRDAGATFGLIGFDACLMNMVEIAYEIRERADVMVAAEGYEYAGAAGEGWPYCKIFSRLAATPSLSATALASAIVWEYRDHYEGNANYDHTLAAIHLGAATERLAREFRELSTRLLTNFQQNSAAIEAAHDAAASFVLGFVDVRELLENFNTRNLSAWSALQALRAIIFASWSHGPNAARYGGMSIFYPDKGSEPSKHLAEYSKLAFPCQTDWLAFLNAALA
jgi:hypothetical protein